MFIIVGRALDYDQGDFGEDYDEEDSEMDGEDDEDEEDVAEGGEPAVKPECKQQ